MICVTNIVENIMLFLFVTPTAERKFVFTVEEAK